MFKSIDKKIEDLGFTKISEDKYGAEYRRKNEQCGYIHTVYIGHKKSGRHIIQSYDENLSDEKGIGNTCVGLTYREMKLFTKKMAKMGLKSV